ncbi:MAG: energy-coupling factor transporter ATPase [Clostridia bacterium]|nr:energy-coupling factor transporter ATPase [Clostridia bacterium]MDE6758965.1 energy-coupling factor transporter ATPase [Clostridia bacterium]MDE7079627.1 energy-coupling factor transporter ATPase [Clostridia bacterium]
MPIIVKKLSFTYSAKTPYERKALNNINLQINEGDFLGIIGHTGSGKSTFIQHINGLIKPQEGEIEIFDIKLTPQKRPKVNLRALRSQVGMVFQYPEYQLFADTVEKDVAFGPKNLGLSSEEVSERVRQAIEMVGLDYEAVKDRAPFELSGGQKRRVAIAGIIAMRPKMLILDEPTAGLDPYGKEQILNLIKYLKTHCSPTIVVISHDIDEITRFANRIVVFNDSRIVYDEPMQQLFKHSIQLQNMGLDIPRAVKIANSLRDRGIDLGEGIVTAEDLMAAIVERYNQKHAAQIDKEACVFDMYDFSQKWLTSEERAELEGKPNVEEEADAPKTVKKNKSKENDKKQKKSKRKKE